VALEDQLVVVGNFAIVEVPEAVRVECDSSVRSPRRS
jgi:hypothetical protein